MNIYDLMAIPVYPPDQRAKNVFHTADTFKTRVIELRPGQSIPDCTMESHVDFDVVQGEVCITCNDESAILKENQVFITKPAVLTMSSQTGARLMGIQIKTDRHLNQEGT